MIKLKITIYFILKTEYLKLRVQGAEQMKKIILLLTVLFLSFAYISADLVNNDDKPARGEYLFPMEKIWTVNGAGDTLFGLLVSIAISDSGHIYCRDLKNKEFYIFDKNGKFLKKFGEQGEAPGKIQDPGGVFQWFRQS